MSFEWEPCDWMAATGKYDMAKKTTQVEAVVKYDDFPTCGVAATLSGAAASGIKVSADGKITDDFIYGLCMYVHSVLLFCRTVAYRCLVRSDCV